MNNQQDEPSNDVTAYDAYYRHNKFGRYLFYTVVGFGLFLVLRAVFGL